MSPPTSSATSGSLRLTIAFLPTLLIPIGLGAVICEDFGTPGVVSHVRPVILVETGSAFEQLLIDVQNELLFNRVEGATGNRTITIFRPCASVPEASSPPFSARRRRVCSA